MSHAQRILQALADGPKPIKYLDDILQANAYSALKQLEQHGCIKRVWHDRGGKAPGQKKRHVYMIEATGKEYRPWGNKLKEKEDGKS